MEYKGFKLDQFQVDAITAIKNNHSVIVSAPTGSGKTLIADYMIERDIRQGRRIIYTAPIKALSNQKYKDFSEEFGENQVGLLTGDEVKNPTAQLLIMTTEVYRNMVIVKDSIVERICYVVLDEIHFINDIERGSVWEESIIFSPDNIRFLCLSATIPNHNEFAAWIQKIKGHKVDVILHDHRPVPLEIQFYDADLGITSLEQIKSIADVPHVRKRHGKWKKTKPNQPHHYDLVDELGNNKQPILFFCFSRVATQRNAEELGKKKFIRPDPEIISFIRKKLADAPSEINNLDSMQALRELLPKHIGFHHAGLLPKQKEMVEELFSQGLLDVLYTTETFAVGINMPAKTVCFESLRKFNGINFANLTTKEFFQMAGRAGRRGMDPMGFAVAMIDKRFFKYDEIKQMSTKDTEPLHSQFRLSVNTVLNLIDKHPKEERDIILQQSFYTFQQHNEKIMSVYRSLVRKLIRLEYISGDYLTDKGRFASMIFCDEIKISEIFATDVWQSFDDYQLALLIATMVYEPRKRTLFYNQRRTSQERDLIKYTQHIIGIRVAQRAFLISALIFPIFHGDDFFAISEHTNLDEGDILRLLGQILDRIDQIKKATINDELRERLKNIDEIVNKALENVR